MREDGADRSDLLTRVDTHPLSTIDAARDPNIVWVRDLIHRDQIRTQRAEAGRVLRRPKTRARHPCHSVKRVVPVPQDGWSAAIPILAPRNNDGYRCAPPIHPSVFQGVRGLTECHESQAPLRAFAYHGKSVH